jgi:dipeptidyl-peptidase-4
MNRSTILLAIILTSASAVFGDEAAEEPSSILTLERIFGESEFKSESFPAKWLEEGSEYTFFKKIDEGEHKGSREIWIARPGQGESKVLVSASELTPPGKDKPLEIQGYAFSKNLSLLLIYTNSERVWRSKSRGDYWLLDRSSHELRKLGGEAPPSSLQFAKISPTGRHVAYVRDRDIYVEDLLDHSIRSVTKSPGKNIFNGKFDWVYEEELQIRDGFRWSPDGSAIAYWQFDESGVRKHTLVDHVSGLYPKLTQFAYPKVGQRNAACRIGVVDLSTDATRWMDLPGDSRNHYLARMDWAENSRELVVQQLNRAQDRNHVLLANSEDGSVETILTEHDPAWVDVNNEMKWVRGGEAFTWISDRDGWRHIYLVSRNGKKTTCLTPGDFDVTRLLTVDDSGEWVYFLASPDNPVERYLYRVGLDGSNLARVTPAEEERGTHGYNISPDGRVAIVTSSTFDDPPVTRLVTLPGHEELLVLEDNEKLRKKVDALDRSPVEFFNVDIGEEISLPARCLKPPNFDPKKKYPLLIYVYGEPAGQVVTDKWGGNTHVWHLMLAQQGYVVMSFDNRGTNVPRGREWRKATNRQIGILAPRDQAVAVRSVLKARPYLDSKRVGSWGSSGGGSMSLNAIFKYPELYSTAIAIASVPNQRHYDTIYQERYMGLPSENVDGYRDGSPINFAHQLEGDLLIIHGAADDNCHYQTFEKLVDKLIQHNKPFSMMTYPRATHAMREGKNTSRHLYETMTRFLHQHLPPTP